MLKPLIGGLSPAGKRAKLSILIFHRVRPAPDPLFPGDPDAARFDAICGWVRAWFDVLPLDKAVQMLKSGTLPARAMAITFDDGYADNQEIALPILRRHGLTATFFVATGFLDGRCMWNDLVIEAVRTSTLPALDLDALGCRGLEAMPIGTVEQKRATIEAVIGKIRYLPVAERETAACETVRLAKTTMPAPLMMSVGGVKALRHARMGVGAHTVSHPILASLEREAALEEMRGSKLFLEAALDEPVSLFAYPNGRLGDDYNSETVTLVRELGFEAALATDWGAAGTDTDPFQLPRFTPWDRTRLAFGARLARNLL